MIPLTTIIACVFTLIISLVLPIAILLVFALKNKKQGIISAWLLGACGFVFPQLLIRLPLLTLLQGQSWFTAFAQNKVFLYVLSLAFTAGLFELAGRYAVAKNMSNSLSRKSISLAVENKLTWKRALAAGLGHGGIEAMLLIGMTYVNNLIYIVMINSGSFDALIAQSAALGVDVSQLELIRTQLIDAAPGLFMLAGLERLLTMIGHLAMSVLVCYGVAHKKTGICLLLCLIFHTLLDLSAGLAMVLPQSIAYPVIYAFLAAMAAVSVLILKKLRRLWQAAPSPSET